MDEAGQVSLANVVAVSGSARNVVLLGDPQQLDQPTGQESFAVRESVGSIAGPCVGLGIDITDSALGGQVKLPMGDQPGSGLRATTMALAKTGTLPLISDFGPRSVALRSRSLTLDERMSPAGHGPLR